MELIDLFFWTVGRVAFKLGNLMKLKNMKLSDGGLVTLGFFISCLTALCLFIGWAVLNG